MFAIPNGGLRNKFTAYKLKAEGVKAGVPDIFLPVPSNDFHGLFIEMKFGKNKPTDSQEIWHIDLALGGYKVAVCYSFEDAQKVITSYLKKSGVDS